MDPHTAVQKELIEKPGTTAATVSRTIPLIMRRKIPSVTILIGRDIMTKKGFNVAFTMPNTIPASKILIKLLNSTPDRILLTTKNEIALIIQEAITLLFISPS